MGHGHTRPSKPEALMLHTSRRQFLKLGLTGLGVMTVPLLAACQGRGEQPAPTGPASSAQTPSTSGAGVVTVRFEGWNYEPALVEQNLKRFMELNPDIKVEYTPIEGSQYRQKIVAEFTAGTQPDALYVRDDYFAGWVTAGYLQDLEGMPGLEEAYSRMYDFNAAAMTYEGKRYGLPYYADIVAFAYNAELLEKAGIKQPPKSLEELEEQGKKLKSEGLVQYPIAFGFKLTNDFWYDWWGLIYASGARLFNDNMEPIMHTQNTVARDVLAWIERGMNETGIVDPASIELDGGKVRDAFLAGQYAYILFQRYEMARANNPEQSPIAGKVKMALVPSLDGENKGTVGWTRMYCLSKTTQVKDAAYRLIYYLGGLDESDVPYTAKWWFMQRGLGFAYKELGQDSEIRAKLRTFVDPDIYSLQAENARARENVQEPWYSEWESENQKLMQQALTRQISVDDVMKGMAANAERFKTRYGA